MADKTRPARSGARRVDRHGRRQHPQRRRRPRDTPEPQSDLGQIVAGLRPGREGEDERIIAVNLGIALEDMATAILVYERAVEMGIGAPLPL